MGCLYSEGATFKTFINACTVKKILFLLTYPIYKVVFPPVHLHPHKNKSSRRKEKQAQWLSALHTSSIYPYEVGWRKKKPVSPFPIKASASSQSLLKWKEKWCPLPHLNGCWKLPESLCSKLMGLDGNTMPYCFGTNCQLMTQQNTSEDSQEKMLSTVRRNYDKNRELHFLHIKCIYIYLYYRYT